MNEIKSKIAFYQKIKEEKLERKFKELYGRLPSKRELVQWLKVKVGNQI